MILGIDDSTLLMMKKCKLVLHLPRQRLEGSQGRILKRICLKKKEEDEEVKAEEKKEEEKEERKEYANNTLSTNYVPDPAVSTLLKLV